MDERPLLTGGSVLLVEDEESIGTLLRTYLGRDG